MDGLSNYTCSCLNGFLGDHCETGNNRTITRSLVMIFSASCPPVWQLFYVRDGIYQQRQQQNPARDCTEMTDLI